MAESRVNRYRRYIKYMSQWFFLEKVRGLDFTMRDTSLISQSGGVFHGYSKTDESHAKLIFDLLGVSNDMRLLDVGCGNGAFLREGAKYPFGEIAGLEYVPELSEIAKRNFKRLHLTDRIMIFTGDATKFKKYGNYNVFYFFNPFDTDIMNKVMERIVTENSENKWIILHNPVCADVIESYGGIEIHRLYDEVKSYETVIYLMEN